MRNIKGISNIICRWNCGTYFGILIG